jgi:UPF0042 nucleotide-binding protein
VSGDKSFVIITGLSGAGKTRTLQTMEDLGYYAVDNIPPGLLGRFAELLQEVEGKPKVALVVDLRGEEWFGGVKEAVHALESMGVAFDLIFLTARDEVLVRRYKESRRQHPLAPEGTILEGIARERERLAEVAERATLVLDTSDLSPHALRARLKEFFGSRRREFVVELVSFGFKHGLPLDADVVLDVRFLPNPHYVPELAGRTGREAEVQSWLFAHEEARRYLDALASFLETTVTAAAAEGRQELVVGVGCTGGVHRSVAVAERLAALLDQAGRRVVVRHRDVARERVP